MTPTVAAVVAIKPGIEAVTVVVPPPMGSNATPPVATLVGETDEIAGIVTVRDWLEPPVVVSCATAALLFVTVAMRLPPPARRF